MIIKAPLPVVNFVYVIMFINKHLDIVASLTPCIPKHPPLSDVEKKFDQIQFLNLTSLGDDGNVIRSVNVWFVYVTDFEEIVNDGDKKWSKFEFKMNKFAELWGILINSEVKYEKREFKTLKLWVFVDNERSKPAWLKLCLMPYDERRRKSWTIVKFISTNAK